MLDPSTSTPSAGLNTFHFQLLHLYDLSKTTQIELDSWLRCIFGGILDRGTDATCVAEEIQLVVGCIACVCAERGDVDLFGREVEE